MVKPGSLTSLLLIGLLAPSLCAPEQARLRGRAAAESPDDAAGFGTDGAFAACSCEAGAPCLCSATRLGGPSAEAPNTSEVQNQTEAMVAWWQAQGELHGLECSCVHGGSCQCHETTEGEESGAAPLNAANATVNGTVNATLKNDTENALSLWWAAHGWGYRGWGYRGYRGWGYRPFRRWGWGCGGAHYGGCGCRFAGCHCGHAGYRGCHWR